MFTVSCFEIEENDGTKAALIDCSIENERFQDRQASTLLMGNFLVLKQAS